MRLRLREHLLYWGLRIVRALDQRYRSPAELGSGSIRTILAISNTALGDTLLSTPGLRALRNAYPAAHLMLLTHPSLVSMLSGFSGVDAVRAYGGRWKGFLSAVLNLRRVAPAPIDLAVIFHGNEPQSTPLAYLAGARYIFKLPNTHRFRFLLTNSDAKLDWGDLGHGIDQRLAVARLAAGLPLVLPAPPLGDPSMEDVRRMSVPLHATETAVVDSLIATRNWTGHPVVALQPGASTTSRRWPRSRFIAAARILLEEHPELRFVVTGSPAEAKLCREVARGINAGFFAEVPVAWASAGELPLAALPSLIARCRVLLTGDTGPMHLAVAVGTPVVALFAVSDPTRSGPGHDLSRHIVIARPRTCDPCLSKRCPYPEPICMDAIAVGDVVAAVNEQLQCSSPEPIFHV